MKRFGLWGRIALVAALVGFSGQGNAKDTVKVGFAGPLTGGVSANGLGGRNSADLAVKLRNADPKAKYRYEMVSVDTECKPNVGVNVVTKLGSDSKVVAVVGHYCSAVAMATVDIYNRFGLPLVVWSAVLPDITYGNSYKIVHRVNGTMINQNDVNAQFSVSQGFKKFAVIHDTTDYGKGHNKYFSEYLKKHGGEIVGTFGVTADQQDFTAELTKIKSLNVQAIYFGGLTPIGVRVRSQMEKLGINAQFIGTSGIMSDAFLQGVGPLSDGVVVFREGAPVEKLPGGQFFMEKYQAAKYAEPAEAYGPFAFAAMNLVLDTIEKVGPNRKKIKESLNKNVRDVDSIVGKITFDDHGQNTVAVITKYVAQGGKWVVWEDSDYASGKRKLAGK